MTSICNKRQKNIYWRYVTFKTTIYNDLIGQYTMHEYIDKNAKKMPSISKMIVI